ncbi:response regulator [bacterium]|nr:response regulator [bacterium]
MAQKILFIEDESALQKSLGDLLREKGFEVISAVDGQTGLRLAKENLPDLILLDLILPRLHGLELLKKLKEDKNTKNIPVVILTNLENIKDVEKAIELGATAYLVKANYSLEEIAEKVKKTLEHES